MLIAEMVGCGAGLIGMPSHRDGLQRRRTNADVQRRRDSVRRRVLADGCSSIAWKRKWAIHTDMNATELKALQTPLKDQYRAWPETALVTLKAEGKVGEAVTCNVETGKALVEAGLHP